MTALSVAPDPVGDHAVALPRATGRRFVFAIDRLAGRGGGAERVLVETANALAARGHLIEIVTHERARDAPFYPLGPGVMLTRLRPPRDRLRAPVDSLRWRFEGWGGEVPGLDRLAWASQHGSFWRRLARYLEAVRPDAVVGFLPPAITAMAQALERLRATGVALRAIASTHNVPEQDFLNPQRWGRGQLDRQRRLAAMAGMDRILVLLPEYRDWYPAALQDRISVLPNPVPVVPEPQRARPEASRVVLSVGRLAPVKRIDLLIDAWASLRDRFGDWQLRIYGRGPLQGALAAQIEAAGLSGSVRLMGQEIDMHGVYRSGALLAHPALHEGFPLAAAEAMASGLPVLGFADCPGVNALVEDGRNGVLVPAGPDLPRARRAGAMADALAALMADPGRRAALGRAGPPSMAGYDRARIIDRWEALLTGAADPGGAEPEPAG